jgi:hypothetical protein
MEVPEAHVGAEDEWSRGCQALVPSGGIGSFFLASSQRSGGGSGVSVGSMGHAATDGNNLA